MNASSTIVLLPDDRVLLIRRSATDHWMPFHWDLPGGGIDPGETPMEAAQRECYEETGLIVNEICPFYIRRMRHGGLQHVFVGTAPYKDVRLSFEHDRFLWGGISDILGSSLPLLNRVRKILVEFRKLKGGDL